MNLKKIIGIVLIAAIMGTGCNAKDLKVEPAENKSVETVDIAGISGSETTETEEKVLVPFEYNPHLYSPKMSERIPQDYWDSFYNLCDALRAGESVFECSSVDAYIWCMDASVLCNLFPAAGMWVDGEFNDGTVSYEDGIGRIHYNMPVDEFVKRQADFEVLIEDILNSNIESDDTDYEKALKLYLYMADNYTYVDGVSDEDNYVYRTFIVKEGMCVNFASAYAFLLMQAGIDALSVNIYEPDMCHSWTYVIIDGEGYHVDATWALKSNYDGVDRIYLDYFLMSDEEREKDGCSVHDLTVTLLPEYWVSKTDMTFQATDDHYNVRDYCSFVSLDEDNKMIYYVDLYSEMHEFYYGE